MNASRVLPNAWLCIGPTINSTRSSAFGTSGSGTRPPVTPGSVRKGMTAMAQSR